MSDEIKATNFGCCESDCDNDWLEWIIIIGVIFFLLCGCGGNGLFGRRGCCR